MPTVPTGFIHQAQLADCVSNAIQKLPKGEVVRVNHSFGTDSTGDPAIFFRIVLSNAASKEQRLADVTGRIAEILFDELRPYEQWGLIPYFSFRSKSEQDARNDPEWS